MTFFTRCWDYNICKVYEKGFDFMQMNAYSSEDNLIVKLEGEIDHHSASGIRENLDRMIAENKPKTMILELEGIDFMDRFGFEVLDVPAGTYAVFKTDRERYPVDAYESLRERIAGEWLPGSGYVLRNAPEFAVYHWYRKEQRDNRYIEIWLPVEK